MPGTAEINGAYKPVNEHDAIPAYLSRPLAASEQVGRGQFVTVDLSTGYAALNDGTVPGQASAGVGDPSTLSDTSSVAGSARIRLSQRHMKSIPASAEAGDGFADTDFGKAFYIADENTPGKLSNFGANDRSLGGLVFGLDTDGYPILWTGPVAWLLARAVQALDATVGAQLYIENALASDTTTERAIHREPVHGLVTGIEFIGAAVTGDGTNFATMTISKRDGAGGAAVVLGTYSTDTGAESTISVFEPAVFTLSVVAGALNLLETDIVTATVTKDGTGQVLDGVIRVVQQVI
jgi:hypothetical protein